MCDYSCFRALSCDYGRRKNPFLPSNWITLNELFVVAHQTAILYWQTVSTSETLVSDPSSFLVLKEAKCAVKMIYRQHSQAELLCSNLLEEKSAEISVGQQDRGTLVFFSFLSPDSSAREIPVYFSLLEQRAAN